MLGMSLTPDSMGCGIEGFVDSLHGGFGDVQK